MVKETLNFSLPADPWKPGLLLTPAKFMVFNMTLNLTGNCRSLGMYMHCCRCQPHVQRKIELQMEGAGEQKASVGRIWIQETTFDK